jgi:hypothetical protein
MTVLLLLLLLMHSCHCYLVKIKHYKTDMFQSVAVSPSSGNMVVGGL